MLAAFSRNKYGQSCCSPTRMVSHTVCTSAEGAEAYFASHLRTGDYFVQDEPGRFHGRLAEKLGVAGQEITAEAFRAFVNADVPTLSGDETQKRPRQSSVKYQEFTYTAPKAFSVAAAVDERLKDELLAAVRDEMSWLESFAAVRDRRGDLSSTETTRQTGNMMAALFAHETSRTNDPNFHVHGLIGNMSLDPDRGQVLALHFGEMMNLRKTLDARIHNNLAARCVALGYGIEVAEHGFALCEIPREAIELFSERSRQIATAKELLRSGYSVAQIQGAAARLDNVRGEVFLDLAQMRAQLASLVPANGKRRLSEHVLDAEAVLLTRPPKQHTAPETLRADVAQRLAAAGITIEVPKPAAPTVPSLAPEDRSALIDRVIEQATVQVFERESVVRLDQLVGEAVRLAPGVISNAEMTAAVRNHERFLVGKLDGKEMITTHKIIAEERELLALIGAGVGRVVEPITGASDYKLPATLDPTPANIDDMLARAEAKGEELTRLQAQTWHRQFAAIHRYVSTATDQFLNIRGGAGVGKTFALELLVAESLKAGRHVILAAPYGEQARVTMRAEASRLAKEGKPDLATVFRTANTVDHLLLRAQNTKIAAQLRGADIYVDEAGLLDTMKALALARLAREYGARIIFQGDTEQMAAVGRGSPIRLLQERLGLGMHIERAGVSRRQLKAEDKRLAIELSSGDSQRFAAALNRLIDRGDVAEHDGEKLIVTAAAKIHAAQRAGTDQLVVSSVHRIARSLSDEVHRLRLEQDPTLAVTRIASLESKDLAPAELRSSQFYRPGDVVELERLTGTLIQAEIVTVSADSLQVRINNRLSTVDYSQVRDVFRHADIERSIGAKLMLTNKIKEGNHVWENKSVHTLARIDADTLIFSSGLKLDRNDGRLQQADVVTAYKAQGAKAHSVLVVEDNRSLTAMASREAMHVLFTRHVHSVAMLVESHEVLRDTAQRTQQKLSALDFARAVTPPPLPILSNQLASGVSVQETAQVNGATLLHTLTYNAFAPSTQDTIHLALASQLTTNNEPVIAQEHDFAHTANMLDSSLTPKEQHKLYSDQIDALNEAGKPQEAHALFAEFATYASKLSPSELEDFKDIFTEEDFAILAQLKNTEQPVNELSASYEEVQPAAAIGMSLSNVPSAPLEPDQQSISHDR